MNNQRDFWQKVQAQLQSGGPVALLCVVESIGSSPGRAGFKMCIAPNSALFGSIGGGIMEKKLVDLTTDLMGKVHGFPFLRRQVHQADQGKDRSGMICSGEQTVAGFLLQGQEADLLVAAILTAFDDRIQPCELAYSPQGIRIFPTGERCASPDASWCFYEALGTQLRIAIVGAGHVSLALSRQMEMLGFHITVFDDRQGLNTWEANTWAHEKRLVDYADMAVHLPADPDLYVVLASVGYRTDDIVLRQLIRNQYKYLGMLGSTEKVRVMFEAMRSDGFTEEELARVHTPIGLPIHSRTPEEIAVSIAAEIIGVKNA